MNSPLFTPLTRRPDARTINVRELLERVERGEVRVPDFQRPLRWKSEDVVRLLDSVWRGYPIGSLLFWKRKADAGSVRVGGATIDGPEVADAWWVVDGQQRTTALAASLLDLDHAGDTRWLAHFNPEVPGFQPGPVQEHRIGIDVPVSVLGDMTRLLRWLKTSLLSEEMFERVEEAMQRLVEYSIPAYIVDTDNEQALKGVFARLNSTGARMRADEVFHALLGHSTDGHSGINLELLQQECDLDGFGVPARGEIYKAILAMADHDPTRRLEKLGATESLRLVSQDDTAEALRRTVTFLQKECDIPHISLLPYPVVFIILNRWFHIFPHSDRETRRLLARWVWRGAVSGTHQRAEVSNMRHQLKDIKPGKEQASLSRLLSRVGPEPKELWLLKNFDLRSARSRIETLALRSLYPKDQFGTIRLEELMSSGRIAREIFRSKDSLSPETTSLLRTAANRVLLNSSHTGLVNELKTWSWEEDQEALLSHLIDEDQFARLQENRIKEFLQTRKTAVESLVANFFSTRAAWNEPDLRPVEAYLEPSIS